MVIYMNLKNFFIYLLLGLIQGLTEPLPISSSGHLIIFEYFFNISFSNLDFKIFVNLASFIAIAFYYRNKIFNISKDFFSYIFIKTNRGLTKQNFLCGIYIFISCLPSAIIGIFFKEYIDKYLSSILTVTLCLLFTSLILFLITIKKNTTYENLNAKKSFLIGLGQIIGLIPGISRSGITTFFGINNKLSLEEALDFSFLMYLPTSLGATFLSFLSSDIISNFNKLHLISFFSSLLGTYFGLFFFFKFVKKNNFKIFAIYLLIVSITLLFII